MVSGPNIEAASRCALVTGASGYVGTNLARALLERGWRVRTFSRHEPTSVAPASIRHIAGDVRDRKRVDEALAGVDVVFHLAAKITLLREDPEAWSINTLGPAIVARAALEHGAARFVHCSSVHAFARAAGTARIDEHSPRPGPARPLYDRSKAAGEEAVRRVIDDGLDAVIVNPTGIIGPVDVGPSRANSILLSAARGHLPIVVVGGFDWIDVRDVVQGLIVAADRGVTGENYLLGGEQATALRIARLAAGLNGHLGPFLALPAWMARDIAPLGERIGHVVGSDDFTPASIAALLDDPIVDCTKAERVLGHKARPIEDTIRDLVWSWRDRGVLDRPRQPRRRRAAAVPVLDHR
jgi:dihydroflavonol-4-reductase